MNKVQTFLADNAYELEQQVNAWLRAQGRIEVNHTDLALYPNGNILHVLHYYEFAGRKLEMEVGACRGTSST